LARYFSEYTALKSLNDFKIVTYKTPCKSLQWYKNLEFTYNTTGWNSKHSSISYTVWSKEEYFLLKTFFSLSVNLFSLPTRYCPSLVNRERFGKIPKNYSNWIFFIIFLHKFMKKFTIYTVPSIFFIISFNFCIQLAIL
jgi:hypothetical protein